MDSVAAFVLAFASTFFIGTIARYAAGFFASDRASRIAAFGVALGYAIGASHVRDLRLVCLALAPLWEPSQP